jgi:phosphoribosyl 1,2-cyclic phosphodiesterase
MEVTIWGSRGSIAVSGERYSETGGNTSCVEIVHEGERLILDGGTGLRALGQSLGFAPIEATILFSHLHWDHIQGVPFFTPAFHPESDLTFVGIERTDGGLREALARQMEPPTFPVGLEALCGAKRFLDVNATQCFEVGPFRVTPFEQPHPNGVSAFRIEAGGKSMVYATDVEHGGKIDPSMIRNAEGTDLLIHDAQYHWAEYTGAKGGSKKGWGHSSWTEAVAVAQQCGARRLALFHHDPGRDDAGVRNIEALAQECFPATLAAREGWTVSL